MGRCPAAESEARMGRYVLGSFLLAIASVAMAQVAAPPATNEAAELSRRIAQLLKSLDAPQFALRRRAEMQLLDIGPPALPALLAAERSPSAEVRERARRVARMIDDREIGRAFDHMSR